MKSWYGRCASFALLVVLWPVESSVAQNPPVYGPSYETPVAVGVPATAMEEVSSDYGTEVPASFKLVKENGEWKLISYQIGS